MNLRKITRSLINKVRHLRALLEVRKAREDAFRRHLIAEQSRCNMAYGKLAESRRECYALRKALTWYEKFKSMSFQNQELDRLCHYIGEDVEEVRTVGNWLSDNGIVNPFAQKGPGEAREYPDDGRLTD
jgi:hypothetical protein